MTFIHWSLVLNLQHFQNQWQMGFLVKSHNQCLSYSDDKEKAFQHFRKYHLTPPEAEAGKIQSSNITLQTLEFCVLESVLITNVGKCWKMTKGLLGLQKTKNSLCFPLYAYHSFFKTVTHTICCRAVIS